MRRTSNTSLRNISQQTLLRACIVGAVVPICCSVLAESAFFMGLGDLPGGSVWSYARDISADGSVVVGQSSSASATTEAFRWTRGTGMVGLGAMEAKSTAVRISDDGSTIIGQTGDNAASGTFDGTDLPYYWTQQTGMVLFPLSPFLAGATGVNGDGSVVVFNGGRWWSKSAGAQPSIPPITRLSDVSSDGLVFTGWDGNAGGYAWSEQGGLIDLGPTPNGGLFTDPQSISADGKVIVGVGSGGPVRWTAETGALHLGALPGGAMPQSVGGVSADGSVIVGRAIGGSDHGAFIWDAVHGSRNLKQVLVDDYGLGASVAGWDMKRAYSVSADGRTIVGGSVQAAGLRYADGTFDANPQGQQEAWIAFLGTPVPEPSTLLLASLAFTPPVRQRRPINRYGPR